MDGKVDCVVHGGDLLFRSKVRLELVQKALAPLIEVADRGVPVLLVPGNHERSEIPFGLLSRHPNLFIFNRPRTFILEIDGIALSLSGFPFFRGDVRSRFTDLVEETGWRQAKADVRFLCLHHCVEGARVGPVNYTFRSGDDVIRTSDLPSEFSAVLSGHIHRAQVIRSDLSGKALASPILYPGSIERTSFAEKDEKKGYFMLGISLEEHAPPVLRWNFRELPARPMVQARVDAVEMSDEMLVERIKMVLSEMDPNSVVQLRLAGIERLPTTVLKADHLRSLAPPTMNLSLVGPAGWKKAGKRVRRKDFNRKVEL